MAQQDIIIDFIVDDSGLDTAIDQLERMGVIDKKVATAFKSTTAEINKQEKALKNTAQAVKAPIQSLEQLDKKTKSFVKNFVEGFEEGVNEALDEAGVSMKEFTTALENAGVKGAKSSTSLRQELKNLTQQIAQAKVNGNDLGAEYDELVQKAGQLRDAIKDAGDEIANAGSDTRGIDNVLGSVQALAGGFAVLQGTSALFGDESEELQKTLLKVNAAMAILQGLQAVQNALQKEGSLIKLADVIATKTQIVVQQIYTAVTGRATAATLGFKVALAATGIGAAVLLVLALVDAFKAHNKQVEIANRLIEREKAVISGLNEVIQQNTDLMVARAKAAGASESELIKLQGQSLQQQRAGLEESNQILLIQRDALSKTSEAWFNLNQQIVDNQQAIKGIDNETVVKGVELQKQLTEEQLQSIVDIAQARAEAARKNSGEDFKAQKALEIARSNLEINAAGQNSAKIIAIRAALAHKLRDIDRAAFEQRQREEIAALETQFLRVQEKSKQINERNTQAEIDLQKQLIIKKANLEAAQEGLSQKQITEIKLRGITEAARLQREFNKQSNKEALEDFISRNNAELSRVQITEQEKLNLVIDNIIAQSEIELEENRGLSEKIKEINAKRDRDIKEARLASIRSTLDLELQNYDVDNAKVVRALAKSLNDQDKLRAASNLAEQKQIEKQFNIRRVSVEEQIAIINRLATIESDAIQKRIDALNKEKDQKLISQEEYNLRYKQLVDQQTQVWETAEQKKTEITVIETQKRRERTLADIQIVVDTLTKMVGVLEAVFTTATQKENERLAAQKQLLEDLREAGAITEKEAISRQKRLEAEEKKARQRQAQRDKTVAVFNALLAIPSAILQGLRQGGPILAAIYGGLAAVQAGIIIARPVPKFGKGKKDSYSGPGMVGETGTEMIERNGKLYVTTKPTITYLGPKDKVFTPAETKRMMPKVDKSVMKREEGIDYKKLSSLMAEQVAAILKGNKTSGPVINIDKEFISESVSNGLIKNNYFDRYYTSKLNGH